MCLTPYLKKSENVFVPCGRCPQCKARDISSWSFRLMQHMKNVESAYFVTLTYDNDRVPVTQNGYMGLLKKDLQNFFKRLRKSHDEYWDLLVRSGRTVRGYKPKPLKYFAVGEYGGRSYRPHYHIILFNARLELITPAWSKVDRSTGEIIPFGFVHLGDDRGVNEASVGYTCKYIAKPKRIPLHRNDDRVPEFRLMSKGLGADYLSVDILKWHLADVENRMYCTIDGGKKISMPRYFKDRIYSDEQRKAAAEANAAKIHEQEMKDFKHLKDPVLAWRNRRSSIKEAIYNASTVANAGRDKI